jgi:hypothetical protein
MSMGGSGPEVLTTLTTNPGKILDGLHRTKIGGESHLYTGIMIASVSNAVASYLNIVADIKPSSSPSSTAKTNPNASASSSLPALLSPTPHPPSPSSLRR